jgi:DNA polymerase
VEEMMRCDPYLQSQISLIQPKIIVCLGSTPVKWILKTTEGITNLRGRWFDWKGIKVIPMFHPSYLLRNPSSKIGSPKHLTWLDIQKVKEEWEKMRTRSPESDAGRN